jgi:hypothetical protein
MQTCTLVGGFCDFDFQKFSFVSKLPYLLPYPGEEDGKGTDPRFVTDRDRTLGRYVTPRCPGGTTNV